MEDDEISGSGLVEVEEYSDASAGVIHEGLGLYEENFSSGIICFTYFRLEFFLKVPFAPTPLSLEIFNHEETEVVSGSRIFFSGISQTNDTSRLVCGKGSIPS